VDVEIPTREESSVEPHDPNHLKVYAAFAEVLHLCVAVEYADSVERDAEMEGTLRLNGRTGPTGLASCLRSKLAFTAYSRSRLE